MERRLINNNHKKTHTHMRFLGNVSYNEKDDERLKNTIKVDSKNFPYGTF